MKPRTLDPERLTLMAVLLFSLVACVPVKNETITGYVRSTNWGRDRSFIDESVIELPDGELRYIKFACCEDRVLWPGMHAAIEIKCQTEEPHMCRLLSARRLP